jgi:hypothetical protein
MDNLLTLLAEPLAWTNKGIIGTVATNVLITPYGKCNWMNIRTLRDKGYDVYPGEQDSFGWLSGIIERSDGVQFVFG